MKVLSIEESKKEIEKLGLPQIYQDILDKKDDLFDYWRYPHWLYSDPAYLDSYISELGAYDEIFPLCEEGGIAALVAVARKDNTTHYIHMVYEDPSSLEVYDSYQALLFDLFMFYWESKDGESDLQDLGDKLGYKYAKETNEFLYEINGIYGSDEFDSRIREFKNQLNQDNDS